MWLPHTATRILHWKLVHIFCSVGGAVAAVSCCLVVLLFLGAEVAVAITATVTTTIAIAIVVRVIAACWHLSHVLVFCSNIFAKRIFQYAVYVCLCQCIQIIRLIHDRVRRFLEILTNYN